MSATGLEVLDRTLQKTDNCFQEGHGGARPRSPEAYHALRAVLHNLRDRLTVDEAAHLSA